MRGCSRPRNVAHEGRLFCAVVWSPEPVSKAASQLRGERCQGSGLSSGVPGDDGFYLGVVLAMPMVPLASPHSPGKVFK